MEREGGKGEWGGEREGQEIREGRREHWWQPSRSTDRSYGPNEFMASHQYAAIIMTE